MIERIYGIEYQIPDIPQKSKIANFHLDKKKQKFYKVEIPECFEELEFDQNDEPVYEQEHLDFIDQELDRIHNGYWYYNNGHATFITGLHYFYLNYWTLENGEAPEYRDCDRRYFCFYDYCRKQPHIYGIIRSKKRREGATSQATATLVRQAITQKKAFCGIVSKTGKDAKDCFIKMVQPGFRALPIFLKPRVQDAESKTELFFLARKSQVKRKKGSVRKKGEMFDSNMGLGSIIDYRTTELNSYDSGRLTEALLDEMGKAPTELPANEYWEIVKQTLTQGGVKVGFANMPSTSNKLTKGGRGFKTLWDDSNQFQAKKTGTGLYRYFCPADDGFPPYISEFGQSIREQPTREEAKWMKEHYGADDEQCSMSAKDYILLERSRKKDDDARREHTRMFPLEEKDAFDFDNSSTIYNRENIVDQKQVLQDNPPKFRRVTFFRNNAGKADWADDAKGTWLIHALPTDTEKNMTVERNGMTKPANSHKYVLVADPFKNTIISGKGSKGCGMMWSKLDPLDPENTGRPLALYFFRPKLKHLFNTQMLLAAEYYGAMMLWEIDLDDIHEWLAAEKKTGYLHERPRNTIDPNRKRKELKKEYGVKAADGFSYNMMIDRSQAYVELYCGKIAFMDILDQLEEFDPNNRTDFDIVAAFQLGTIAISDPVKPKTEVKRSTPVVKTYRLRA